MSIMKKTKRGDTVIEVMFALAIFSFAAILAIGVMNGGVNSAETTLELSTARNEMEAQAEAIRFIHTSYNTGGKALWTNMVKKAVSFENVQKMGITDLSNYILTPDENGVSGCQKVYEKLDTPEYEQSPLWNLDAFILNARKLALDDGATGLKNIIYSVRDTDQVKLFRDSSLNARILYTTDETLADSGASALNSLDYSKISLVEGIWVFVVASDHEVDKGGEVGKVPQFYDFYIDACWYGPGARTPTAIDTVIRLYNPEAT